MKRRLVVGALAAAAVVAAGAAAGSALHRAHPARMSLYVALVRNTVRSWMAPAGATTTERNPAYRAAAAAAPTPLAAAAAVADGDWPSYNRTLTSERYSPLAEINTNTVGKLKVLCTYDTGEYTSFESGLIVVEGALIGTTRTDIFSLNPATCAENWRKHEEFSPSYYSTNRGAAYLDGKLFRGVEDGQVLAYDLKTGERIWETAIADQRMGEAVPAAPIVWDGLVFVGNASGDAKGGKGRMYALDANTGKIVWEFYLVPKTKDDPTRGPQGLSPLDTSTWINAPGIPISGGGTWTSFTLDPGRGELYVPVGNPLPDYASGVREGENLFTGSVVVLDAKTGAYKRHFRIVPADRHDWDVASPPSLIETAGGKRLMTEAPKDGYLYGVDLAPVAALDAKMGPYKPHFGIVPADTRDLDVASSPSLIKAAGGKKLMTEAPKDAYFYGAENRVVYRVPVTRFDNVDAPFSVEAEVRFCPGASGGSEWNGPAYDPQTNLILIGEIDWCTTVKLQTEQQLRDAHMGEVWFGMATLNPFHILGRQDDGRGSWGGWVYAVDADSGVWKWRLKSNYPIVGGVTPTAGGLVFFGDIGGNFYALDAATGDRLWGRKIGGAIGGGVIAYKAGGREKIAVTTGFTGVAWPTEFVTGKIVVLGIDGDRADR